MLHINKTIQKMCLYVLMKDLKNNDEGKTIMNLGYLSGNRLHECIISLLNKL